MTDAPRNEKLLALAFGAEDEPEPVTETKEPAGEELGRYLLVEALGRGGAGTVYKALDRGLGRFVALKVLNADALDSFGRERFLREARTAASLRHPGIVAVHEISIEGERPFYTMDLVEGPPLLQDGSLPPREVARLGVEVARALQFAHERGVIHRDVKPHNIVLTKERRPVLVDFGLAREIAPDVLLTRTGAVVGTPAFMSPEQASGQRSSLDARCDVYALGATLHQLLSGKPPHTGTDPIDVLLKARTQDAPRLPGDPGLAAIVEKALARSPRERYATAEALALDLEAWLAGRRPAALARRRSPLLVVGALLVAGVVALLAHERTPRWWEEMTPRPRLPANMRPASLPRVYVFDNGNVPIEMVHVPAGPTICGCEEVASASPVHTCVVAGFFIGRFETTWAQYHRFTKATYRWASKSEWHKTLPDLDRHPAMHVSWDDARAFCEWVGLRLPGEIEWEKAARGPSGAHWPWGGARREDFKVLANYNDKSCEASLHDADGWKLVSDGFPFTAPVGSFPEGISPYGAYDMAGNVDEWCSEVFDPEANKKHGNPGWRAGEGAQRSLRGGNFLDPWYMSHPANRGGAAPGLMGARGVRPAISEPRE